MTPVELFYMLSHPTRWKAVEELINGPKTVGYLTEVAGVSQPNMSQHLTKLKDIGVVTAERKATNVFYSLSSNQVKNVVRCAMREMG